MNKSLLIIKNHIVEKNLQWLLLHDLSKEYLQIDAVYRYYFDYSFYLKFYDNLIGKSFYEELCMQYSKGDVFVVHISGSQDVIEKTRALIGVTDPELCLPLQIRHTYGISISLNAVHASEDLQNYIREIDLINKYGKKKTSY